AGTPPISWRAAPARHRIGGPSQRCRSVRVRWLTGRENEPTTAPGSRFRAYRIVAAGSGHHGLQRVRERLELSRGEASREMVPDAAQVQGTGAAHPGTAGGRQDRPGDPAVFGTWPTLDEPGLDHPIDQPGDAARAQAHMLG